MPDDDVVETLAGDRLVIGDDHVARRDPLPAVVLHAVGDDNAKIGYKMRNAADKAAGAIVKPYQVGKSAADIDRQRQSRVGSPFFVR